MDETLAIARLVRMVEEYASGRARDVERGAETPRLAALLVQKYGLGVADAAAAIFDSPRAADPVSKAVDEETATIDPLCRKHAREGWDARPADLSNPK